MSLSAEKRTISAMMNIYCNDHHGTDFLCSECSALLDYAYKRIDHCTYGADKPACKDCTIHCYAKEKREKIKEVMRYSGRKMPLRYPYLSAVHLMKSIVKR
jgi:hypothetical protein